MVLEVSDAQNLSWLEEVQSRIAERGGILQLRFEALPSKDKLSENVLSAVRREGGF
jgi:hypothetical protein